MFGGRWLHALLHISLCYHVLLDEIFCLYNTRRFEIICGCCGYRQLRRVAGWSEATSAASLQGRGCSGAASQKHTPSTLRRVFGTVHTLTTCHCYIASYLALFCNVRFCLVLCLLYHSYQGCITYNRDCAISVFSLFCEACCTHCTLSSGDMITM